MKQALAVSVLALGLGLPASLEAQFVQNDAVTFEALNQSMWGGSGPGSVTYDAFLGASWNTSLSVGGIVGSANETIIPGGCADFGLFTVCVDPVTADTRTGLAVTANTDGRIGVDVGATINAGRVDVTMPGQATVSTDDLTGHAPGSDFTLATGFAVDPTATMHTQFPSLELFADFVFDVHADASAEACIIFAGCSTSSATLFDVNKTVELASFNRDNSGQFRVLGSALDWLGVDPLSGSLGPVNFTISPPDLETDAQAPATTLSSSGEAQVLDLSISATQLLADAILPGSGQVLSGNVLGLGWTLLDLSVGPRFGIGQAFTFTSTPMVNLAFSTPVSSKVTGIVGYEQFCIDIPFFGPFCFDNPAAPIYGTVTLAPSSVITVPLGTNLDLVFPDAMSLDVTPTYWLSNSLHVNTDLLSRLGLNLTVLELTTPLGNLGPLFEADVQTDPVSIGIDDRTFSMAFNQSQGATFTLSTTPEPSSGALLATGLAVVGLVVLLRRRPEGFAG